MLTQQELLTRLRPLLEKEGRLYQKVTRIFARPAREGEVVNTVTADGLETVNVARPGDWLVRNQTEAEEQYLISAAKFTRRYECIQPADDGWAEYRAVGRIRALELTPQRLNALDLCAPFDFVAPWGSLMTARQGDFLACPEDGDEVYRIARAEFEQTYLPLDERKNEGR
ncbi:MAG: PGDYG domain-containing protein [Saprospiraceae bacterium]|nr:PGDYG domain-containing protein [Saprospiraceae bacterium]MDW8483635.1 PGDYG domain-containing protein [Saprospiraceae bacterium]